MSRRPPACQADQRWLPSDKQAQSGRDLLDVAVSVVTPMFGGGARPRAADPLLPVRGAAIRGHLRFWWRACRGGAYSDLGRLFADEEKYWGSTKVPAAIEVALEITTVGQGRTYRDCVPGGYFNGQQHPLAYALFPFRDDQHASAWTAVTFTLRLRSVPAGSMAQLRAEAEAALWAWITFGGLGARTRRGCGALFCDDNRFSPLGERDVADWLQREATRHVLGASRQLPLPILAQAGYVQGRTQAVIDAWSNAVAQLRDFRQAPGIARAPVNPATKRPGRSYWSEADSVRDACRNAEPYRSDAGFNTDLTRHAPRHPAMPFFPKADLGVPVIYQRIGPRGKEPRIEGTQSGMTRFASPIVLKPLAVSKTQAVPLALCLNAPHVWEGPPIALRGGTLQRRLSDRELGNDAAKMAASGATFPPLNGRTSVRAAFLDYIAGQWGGTTEVLP